MSIECGQGTALDNEPYYDNLKKIFRLESEFNFNFTMKMNVILLYENKIQKTKNKKQRPFLLMRFDTPVAPRHPS